MAKTSKRIWRGFMEFLEIVGLRDESDVDPEAQLAALRQSRIELQRLLRANNSYLERIAGLEQKMLSREPVSVSYLKNKVINSIADIQKMINCINGISGGRYPALQPALEGMAAALSGLVEGADSTELEQLALDMSAVQRNHADIVGGKMAGLCEIRNALGLPTPDGFVVTTEAFRLVYESAGVAALLDAANLNKFSSDEEITRLSAAAREKITQAKLPERVAGAILSAYDRLAEKLGGKPFLAVRSSAVGEDSSLTFAGQFHTELNVPREGLLSAYLGVAASLYSPGAIRYRMTHGFPSGAIMMAAGCIAMVDAEASGIMYSNDPNHPIPGHIIIHSVRGLGAALAVGEVSPEKMFVSREPMPRVLSRAASSQADYLRCVEKSGVAECSLADELRGKNVISDDEALQLARWARELETHFGSPRDIEWAIDKERRIKLLQSRPLAMSGAAERTGRPIEDFTVLLSNGDTACPGVGAGPAVFMDEDGDFDAFPDGGVLVTRRSSPKFIRIMAKARAIVTDAGSTIGHMASLTREFGVPALLNTGAATRAIPEGALITVDATNGFVYSGIIPFVEGAPGLPRPAGGNAARPPVDSLRQRVLEGVAALLIPINLTNPRSPNFTVENCRTLHDLARIIHEKSYEEIFHVGEALGDARAFSYHLDVFLPIDLYIIDVGGAVTPPAKGRKVKLSSVKSAPLTSLLRGMLHPDIPRFGPRPLDAGGFFSLMMRHAISNPENERSFRDPCYVIASDRYINYTSRVGYHFSVVDAYCGDTMNNNYINLLFRGGAADKARRSRRARAIADILKEHGFTVDAKWDTVTARFIKSEKSEIEARLDIIGRLFQFMRQMDVAMSTDEHAAYIKKAFLEGDYGLAK